MHRIMLEYYLWRTAIRWKVSTADVRKNIADMLAEARRNADVQVQAAWAAIPCAGSAPTTEETIDFLVRRLQEDQR